MDKVKKVDCALLPPCAKTLSNKLRRAHYVSMIWRNAEKPNPDIGIDPLHYGWREENGQFMPDWFPGNAMPEDIFASENDIQSIAEESHDTEDSDDTVIIECTNDSIDTEPEWSDDSDSGDEL